MKKLKDSKPFTINSAPHRVVSRIQELEGKLKGLKWYEHDAKNVIKEELNDLYKLRKKQKNYKPVKSLNLKKGL